MFSIPQQERNERPALKSKKSLTSLLGLGFRLPSAIPALPFGAAQTITQHYAHDNQHGESEFQSPTKSYKQQTSVSSMSSFLDSDPYSTPKRPIQAYTLRQISCSSQFSEYFPTPKAVVQVQQVQRPTRALRAVKSMETFNKGLGYSSLSIMGQQNVEGEGYSSMQELLSSRGFMDTRVITPDTFKAKTTAQSRPAAQTIFTSSTDNDDVASICSSTHSDSEPSSPIPEQKITNKPSLVGLLRSFYSGPTQQEQGTPVKALGPSSPRSLSSHASDDSLSESEDAQNNEPEIDSQTHKARVNTWIASTAEESIPSRPLSPVLSTRSGCSSIRSARSFASLSTHQPAPPSLCLESDPRWLESNIFPPEQSPPSASTARPNEELRRRLRHAVSVPIFRDPAKPSLATAEISTPGKKASKPKRKELRKTASQAILQPTAVLAPVLTQQFDSIVARGKEGMEMEKTQVVKMPSPERKVGVEPQGVRQDVRALFPSTSTQQSISTRLANSNGNTDSPTPMTRKRQVLGNTHSPLASVIGNSKSSGQAQKSLKDLLGKTNKTLPFSVGIIPPAGLKRLGKGVKTWEVEDVENEMPRIVVDRV